MLKFKHIVLLAALCLFSSALIGADKVAEQIVKDFEKYKQSTIDKLKMRMDALAKAGKDQDAKEVEGMIANITAELPSGMSATKDTVKNDSADKLNKFYTKLKESLVKVKTDFNSGKIPASQCNLQRDKLFEELIKDYPKYIKNMTNVEAARIFLKYNFLYDELNRLRRDFQDNLNIGNWSLIIEHYFLLSGQEFSMLN